MTSARKLSITAALVFLLVLLGVWQGWKNRPLVFVSQIYAVSDARSVLLLRQNTNQTARFWVSLQSTDGPVWVHRLPDGTRDVVWNSLIATDELVTFQRKTADAAEVVALALNSGQPVWRAALGEAIPFNPSPFLYADSRAHGSVLLEPTDNDQMVALDLETGAVRWRTRLYSAVRIQRYDSDAVWFVDQEHHFSKLILADGAIEVGPSRFNHCLDQDRFLTLKNGMLQDEEGTPLTESLGLSGTLYACGRYDGELVVTIMEDGAFNLLRIHDGVVQQRLRLDWELRLSMSLGGTCELQQHNPLHGALTRYLPLILSRDSDDPLFDLVVVDLDSMQLQQAMPQRDYLHFKQIREGAMHYLWYHGGLLIALDGQTGALTGAVHGGRFFSSRQVASGAVWLAQEGSAGWRPPRYPAAAWLDGRSLAVQGTTGRTDAFSDAGAAVTELTGWEVGQIQPDR